MIVNVQVHIGSTQEGPEAVEFLGNFPVHAIAAIIDVLEYGKSKGYPSGSWRTYNFGCHLNKAIGHLEKYAAGDTDEDHLECALTRLAMAVDIRREERDGG